MILGRGGNNFDRGFGEDSPTAVDAKCEVSGAARSSAAGREGESSMVKLSGGRREEVQVYISERYICKDWAILTYDREHKTLRNIESGMSNVKGPVRPAASGNGMGYAESMTWWGLSG